MTEDRINELEDRTIEYTHYEELRDSKLKNKRPEQKLRDLYSNNKRSNIQIIEVPGEDIEWV